MSFNFVSVLDYGLAPAAEVFTRGFSDYFVKIVGSPAMLVHMARIDSVDLAASKIVLRDGVAVGAALMARRGWTCRLAGMAVVPEGRRQGAARAMVEHLLCEAQARRDRAMVLEVIEPNEPGVRLYEACGFRRVRRLVGFVSAADAERETDPGEAKLEEIDLRSVGTKIAACSRLDLPWQLSGETVAQLGPPHRGFICGHAGLAIGDPEGGSVGIRTLAAEGMEANPERGAEVLRAVQAKFPGKEWRMSALWPEELAPVFTGAGFTRTPLSQWQMECPLEAVG
jgi:ribosomal protein S18 acetylase RimI-like enzyme